MDERKDVQRAFADEAQILVSTEAGGEGLNLQFCHIVVNYDLPWNPMKLEQRIGRVDRIGQKHVVRALNFALDDTVELRVREVLEEKLQRILEEYGVDKLSDVLDSEEGGVDFEKLYVEAMLSPEKAEQRAEELAEGIRSRAFSAREGASILGATEELDPSGAQKVAAHQMPFWTERMTLAWLRSQVEHGAQIKAYGRNTYDLRWPDGDEMRGVTFGRATTDDAGLTHLTTEDARVRTLMKSIPRIVPGLPIPTVVIPGVSDKVSGFWSLWRISLQALDLREQRILPVFVNHDGQMLGPTSRVVWDRLIGQSDGVALRSEAAIDAVDAKDAFALSRSVAEDQGAVIFQELKTQHQQRLVREQRKMTAAFAARRRAIERIGLLQVRDFRLAQLDKEESTWRNHLAEKESVLPDLRPLLLLAVAADNKGAGQ
jgi:hypothetical protein